MGEKTIYSHFTNELDDLGPINDDPLVDDFTAKCQRCRNEYDIFEYSMCPGCLRYLSLKAANTIDLIGSPLWYGDYWNKDNATKLLL